MVQLHQGLQGLSQNKTTEMFNYLGKSQVSRT